VNKLGKKRLKRTKEGAFSWGGGEGGLNAGFFSQGGGTAEATAHRLLGEEKSEPCSGSKKKETEVTKKEEDLFGRGLLFHQGGSGTRSGRSEGKRVWNNTKPPTKKPPGGKASKGEGKGASVEKLSGEKHRRGKGVFSLGSKRKTLGFNTLSGHWLKRHQRGSRRQRKVFCPR